MPARPRPDWRDRRRRVPRCKACWCRTNTSWTASASSLHHLILNETHKTGGGDPPPFLPPPPTPLPSHPPPPKTKKKPGGPPPPPFCSALAQRRAVAARGADVQLARTADLVFRIGDHLFPLRHPADGAGQGEDAG